jgi:hypothetical protein
MAPIFDKSRLTSDEFKKYIYEIPFKNKGGGVKKVKGMTAAGYIHAIHPHLRSIKSEVISHGTVGARNILACVVKVTVTISPDLDHPDRVVMIEGLADGDLTGVPSADTLVRTVETRALNRALGRVLDVSNADLNNPDGEPDEEESGTPVYRPSPFAEKMIERKEKTEAERKRLAELEGSSDDKTNPGRLPDNTGSEAKEGSSEKDDW